MLGGRLGAYKYWDMDKAIRNALDFAETLEIQLRISSAKKDFRHRARL